MVIFILQSYRAFGARVLEEKKAGDFVWIETYSPPTSRKFSYVPRKKGAWQKENVIF